MKRSENIFTHLLCCRQSPQLFIQILLNVKFEPVVSETAVKVSRFTFIGEINQERPATIK